MRAAVRITLVVQLACLLHRAQTRPLKFPARPPLLYLQSKSISSWSLFRILGLVNGSHHDRDVGVYFFGVTAVADDGGAGNSDLAGIGPAGSQ